MVDRHHVGVVVNVLLKELRVTVIGTKSHGPGIVPNVNRGHTGDGRDVLGVATRVPGTRLIHDTRAKGMRPVDRDIRRDESSRVSKTAQPRSGWDQVVLTRPAELGK